MKEFKPIMAAALPVLSLCVVIVLALLTYVPQKVVRAEGLSSVAAEVIKVFPQGWAFFTKAPTSPSFRVYSLNDGEYEQTFAPEGIGWHDAFGIQRAYRNTQAEYEMLERALSDVELAPCPNGDTGTCFAQLSSKPSISFKSPFKNPKVCGTLNVAERSPTPWHWRSQTNETHRTTGVTRVRVDC